MKHELSDRAITALVLMTINSVWKRIAEMNPGEQGLAEIITSIEQLVAKNHSLMTPEERSCVKQAVDVAALVNRSVSSEFPSTH